MKDYDNEKLMKHLTDYYYYVADKMPARLDGITKTWLWVSSLLMSLNIVLLKDHVACLVSFTGVSAATGLFMQVIILMACLYNLRGRGPTLHPDIHAYIKNESGEYDLIMLANQFEEALNHELAERTARANLSRRISISLSISLVVLAIAAVSSAF